MSDNNSEGNSNSNNNNNSASLGLVKSCRRLPSELSTIHQLANAIDNTTKDGSSSSSSSSSSVIGGGKEGTDGTPIRGIIGTIRNVADFGTFIDIGNENNGLMHKSKMGPSLRLHNLLIGQQIGIDVLSVTSTGNNNHRISLGLHGCNYQPPPSKPSMSQGRRSSSSSSTRKSKNTSNTNSTSNSKKRSISTNASSSTTRRRTKQKR